MTHAIQEELYMLTDEFTGKVTLFRSIDEAEAAKERAKNEKWSFSWPEKIYILKEEN